MTNHETARALWGQSLHIRASELADDLAKGSWNLCVRRSQEVVELALKAVLRFICLDYPKRHDVADLFRDAARQNPPWIPGHRSDPEISRTSTARPGTIRCYEKPEAGGFRRLHFL